MHQSKYPQPRRPEYSRHVPHFSGVRAIQHITYRLADSVPMALLRQFEEECRYLRVQRDRELECRRKLDHWLDMGHGSCILSEPEIASLVIGAWNHFDGERYDLHAYVVMPNHCHVLIETRTDLQLSQIVLSWKSYTARRINEWKTRHQIIHDNRVWQREYWDRFIRNIEHYRRVVDYIEQNPVKAGLVANAGEWRWSSAGNR